MTLEGGNLNKPRNPDIQKSEKVLPKTNSKGETWYLDKDRRIVVLDQAGDDERNRQQMEPGTPPASGYPEFERTMDMEEMPAAPGEVVPPEQTPPPDQNQESVDGASSVGSKDATQETPPAGPSGSNPLPPNEPPRMTADDTAPAQPSNQPPEPPREPPLEPENQPSPHAYTAVEGKPIVLDKKRYIGLTIPTLDEIGASPESQQLFGELLSGLRPDKADLFGRMATMGKMDQEEEALVEYCQHEYARRIKNATEAETSMTPQLVQELAKRDEDLARLITRRGADKVSDVMKRRMKHLAMRNEVGFEEFTHATHALHENRDTLRFKRYQNGVESLCQTVGIATKDYDTFFALEKSGKSVKESLERSHEVRNRVREQVRSDMGRSRRAIDSVLSKVRMGSAATARYADRRATFLNAKVDRKWFSPQSWVLSDVNDNLKAIAAYAAYTLTDAENNPEVVEALTRGPFTGEGVRTAEETGPQSRAEADALMKDTYSQPAVKSRLDSFKQSYRAPNTDHDWAHMTEDESSAAYQTFKSREIRTGPEGRGIWALIFGFLRQSLLAQRVNDIEKKRVLA